MLHQNQNPQQSTPEWITQSIEDIKQRLDHARAMDQLPTNTYNVLLQVRAFLVALEMNGDTPGAITTELFENGSDRYVVTTYSNKQTEDTFTTTGF